MTCNSAIEIEVSLSASCLYNRIINAINRRIKLEREREQPKKKKKKKQLSIDHFGVIHFHLPIKTSMKSRSIPNAALHQSRLGRPERI